jgi:hypothetical protein
MCLNCGALYERKGETWQPVTLQALDQENRDINNVVILDVETSLDLPLERVLDGALAAQLTDCLVLGYSADGFYMASQTCDAAKILVLLERCRRLLINPVFGLIFLNVT